ncbi:hypothetical protein CGRA01v4_01188 [Colletotrichum graminicola]|nr:hypothetical protein CGRA01v4_01188 [Colletotrichum graminicola]
MQGGLPYAPAPPPRPQHCRRLLLLLLLLLGSLLLAVHYVACLHFCLEEGGRVGGAPQLRGRTFLRRLWNMGINQKCETVMQPSPSQPAAQTERSERDATPPKSRQPHEPQTPRAARATGKPTHPKAKCIIDRSNRASKAKPSQAKPSPGHQCLSIPFSPLRALIPCGYTRRLQPNPLSNTTLAHHCIAESSPQNPEHDGNTYIEGSY